MKKTEQGKRLITFALRLIIVALLVAGYAYVWHVQYLYRVVYPFRGRGNLLVIAIYAILLIFFLTIYGGLQVGTYSRGNIIFSQMLSVVIVNVISYLQISLIGRSLFDIKPMIILTAVDFLISIIWTIIAVDIAKRIYPPRAMLMVYGSEMALTLTDKLHKRRDKYQVKNTIDVNEGLDKVYEEIKKYNAVVLCDLKTETRNKILKFCFSHSVRTYVTPKISDIIVRGATDISLFDTPLLLCKNFGLTFEQKIIKRIMDIVISLIILTVFSPLLVITAIAIKVYDGGPVFFKQRRCTKDLKEFEILKFRSMIVDAEKDGRVIPATEKDPRITPVGRVIRATRIDEVPQLINVLKGEMSVVGPRPERIEHVEKYTKEIPEFEFRSKVKGGLTGYAQIVGKYNTSAYDKLKLDLMYIEKYSIFFDLRLLIMTVKIVFMRESTEGFEQKEGKHEQRN